LKSASASAYGAIPNWSVEAIERSVTFLAHDVVAVAGWKTTESRMPSPLRIAGGVAKSGSESAL
jgi:hypothetical protein